MEKNHYHKYYTFSNIARFQKPIQFGLLDLDYTRVLYSDSSFFEKKKNHRQTKDSIYFFILESPLMLKIYKQNLSMHQINYNRSKTDILLRKIGKATLLQKRNVSLLSLTLPFSNYKITK